MRITSPPAPCALRANGSPPNAAVPAAAAIKVFRKSRREVVVVFGDLMNAFLE
jgi:hypothetical protein